MKDQEGSLEVVVYLLGYLFILLIIIIYHLVARCNTFTAQENDDENAM